mmetsp:Transcript_39023/g.73221  ORF Transcript_39023/g.73221 Transcript_39023/m.73221 type:complete len:212 (+) Transcript_39023:528-1163(+)
MTLSRCRGIILWCSTCVRWAWRRRASTPTRSSLSGTSWTPRACLTRSTTPSGRNCARSPPTQPPPREHRWRPRRTSRLAKTSKTLLGSRRTISSSTNWMRTGQRAWARSGSPEKLPRIADFKNSWPRLCLFTRPTSKKSRSKEPRPASRAICTTGSSPYATRGTRCCFLGSSSRASRRTAPRSCASSACASFLGTCCSTSLPLTGSRCCPT